MHKKRRLPALLLDAFLTAVLVALAFILLVLMVTRHIPQEYLNTVKMPKETKQRLAKAFIEDVWLLAEKQDTDDPFEITISDDEINAYLLGGLVSFREFIPPEIANPQIHFEENAVVLMGTVVPANLHPMVISIHCRPDVNYDGRLSLVVDKVKGGAIRIPRRLIADVLEPLRETPLVLPNVEIKIAAGQITIYRESHETDE